MAVAGFLVELFGAVFLLLFAVRMVRTGIERAFAPSFQQLVQRGRGPVFLVPLGASFALVLQSSAAVALLAAGFAASGTLGHFAAVAVVLGGDLGSAILVQVLSVRADWPIPVLLIIGGALFLKSNRRGPRQAGRIILGIAFVLIALRFLREAVQPIGSSPIFVSFADWLQTDLLSGFLLGAALAFVMLSSVATILMVVAVVGMGTLPFLAGAAIVLGANLGSAFIPVWLSRGLQPAARRVTLANLALRGAAALAALGILSATRPDIGAWHAGQALIILHIAFNAAVVLSLAFVPLLSPVLTAIAPDPAPGAEPPWHKTTLDRSSLTSAPQSLACLRREVLRMADILGIMFAPTMDLYTRYDRDAAQSLKGEEDAMNSALDEVRRFSADMPHDAMSKQQRREMRALVDYAIALEAAGDIVVKRLVPLAAEMAKGGLSFTSAGRNELTGLFIQVQTNLNTASNVLVSGDVESARALIEAKAKVAQLERASRKAHLKRLTAGEAESFASSDIHLETAYSLKELNSWIVTVAHPILFREGLLLDTRLAPGDS